MATPCNGTWGAFARCFQRKKQKASMQEGALLQDSYCTPLHKRAGKPSCGSVFSWRGGVGGFLPVRKRHLDTITPLLAQRFQYRERDILRTLPPACCKTPGTHFQLKPCRITHVIAPQRWPDIGRTAHTRQGRERNTVTTFSRPSPVYAILSGTNKPVHPPLSNFRYWRHVHWLQMERRTVQPFMELATTIL